MGNGSLASTHLTVYYALMHLRFIETDEMPAALADDRRPLILSSWQLPLACHYNVSLLSLWARQCDPLRSDLSFFFVRRCRRQLHGRPDRYRTDASLSSASTLRTSKMAIKPNRPQNNATASPRPSLESTRTAPELRHPSPPPSRVLSSRFSSESLRASPMYVFAPPSYARLLTLA